MTRNFNYSFAAIIFLVIMTGGIAIGMVSQPFKETGAIVCPK